MKERIPKYALPLAVAFLSSSCVPEKSVRETITPNGRRAVITDCVKMDRVFEEQPIAYACPNAVVTVEQNKDKSLTLFSDPLSGGLTVQFSENKQIGGINADLCGISFEVQSGEVKKMTQNCSFPSNE